MSRNGGGGCCGCIFGCLGSVIFTLLATVGVCGGLYFYASQNMPKPPNTSFTPNAAAASQFENIISQASSNAAQTGRFDVRVTEDQASSWLNLNAPVVADADMPLENMQVRFRNGQTSVYGEVKAFGVTNLGTEFGLSYIITPTGGVEVNVAEVDFAGFGLPDSLRSELSSAIQSAIDSELSKISGRYFVESISSSDGVLVVRGRVG